MTRQENDFASCECSSQKLIRGTTKGGLQGSPSFVFESFDLVKSTTSDDSNTMWGAGHVFFIRLGVRFGVSFRCSCAMLKGWAHRGPGLFGEQEDFIHD